MSLIVGYNAISVLFTFHVFAYQVRCVDAYVEVR
jgi:hypothetical protein